MAKRRTAGKSVACSVAAPADKPIVETGGPELPLPGWLPCALLAAFVLIFFRDSFLAGKAPVMRDTFADFMPWRMFGREAFRAGVLPLWNPYSHAGQPFIANPQTAFFYPPHLLFYVLPPVFALKLWLALHLAVAALSMYALARHWRLGAAAALLAAVGFAFSACMIALMEFQSLFGVYAWFPPALLLTSMLDEVRESGRDARRGAAARRMIPAVLGLSVVFAVQFLSGYQECFFYSVSVCVLFIVFSRLGRSDPAGVLILGCALGVAGLLCLGLSMTQFLLTAQLVPLSIRSIISGPHMDYASFHPRLVMSFLMPFLAGHPGHFTQWWGAPKLTIHEFWGSAVYIGMAPVMLATMVPAALSGRVSRAPRMRLLAWFLVTVSIIGLLMAMGGHTPFFPWCYENIPVLRLFRWPMKYIQLTVFALPLLAALGLHAIVDERDRPWRWPLPALLAAWLTVWLFMAGAWLFCRNRPEFFSWLTGGAFIYWPEYPGPLRQLGSDLGWSVLVLGVVWALVAALAIGRFPARARRAIALAIVMVTFVDLYVVGRQIQPVMDDGVYRLSPKALLDAQAGGEPGRFMMPNENQYCLYGVSDPKLYEQARQTGVGESSLPDHVDKIRGGETLRIKDYESFVNLLGCMPETDPAWQRIANLLNLRFIVRTQAMEAMAAGAASLEFHLERRPEPLPRALVATGWSVRFGARESVDCLLAPEFDPCRMVVVDRVPQGWPASRTLPEGTTRAPITRLADAGVDDLRYGWNRVDVTARSAGRALLFLDDVDYPGWRATVDGREVPILRANSVFRAVPLEGAGTHKVTFTYRPWQVRAGMIATAVTVLIMIGLAWLSIRWRAAHQN